MKRQALKSSISVLLGLILLSTPLVHGQTGTVTMDQTNNEQLDGAVTKPLYDFTGQLYKNMKVSQNLILSPISIHKALNMALLGADANSQTKEELLKAIGYEGLSEEQISKCHEDYAQVLATFKSINDKTQEAQKSYEAKKKAHGFDRHRESESPTSPTMHLFNMMVVKNKAQPNESYAANINKFYHASIRNISDEKPETKTELLGFLNDWAKEAGFESPIMKPDDLNENFEALLLSAIKVQAFWFEEFYEHKKKDMFYIGGLKDRPVEGLAISNSDIKGSRYLELTSADKAQFKSLHKRMESSQLHKELRDLDCQVVEIPLEGDVKFTIFEPLSHSNETSSQLEQLVEHLFGDNANSQSQEAKLSKVLQLLDSEDAQITVHHLTMPKFKFESDLNLKPVLMAMGLRRIFDHDNAQLSHITSNKLCIDQIKHLAVVEVNKQGIKAAGVTLVKLVALSALNPIGQPLRVEITKPFLFLIRYKSVPLFVGQLISL